MLTFEFGEPHLRAREPKVASGDASEKVRRALARRRVFACGAWHLWIYCCNWRVLEGDEQIAWSEDANAIIDQAASLLDGQKLLAVDLDSAKVTSRFTFDLGATIETWRYEHGDGEHWFLYAPDKKVLSLYADGRVSWETASKEPRESG